MAIRIVSIGTKLPAWSSAAFNEYHKRLPKDWSVCLTEIPAQKRLKNTDLDWAMQQDSQKLWQQCQSPEQPIVVALDRTGKNTSSHLFARQLQDWKNQGQAVHFIIGGPEGICDTILKQCHHCWSFSELTFPHPLVRVILIEQIYRAFCIATNKTYHR